MIHFLTFLIFLVSSSVLEGSASRNGRIIGGQEANAGQFPFMAAINVTTRDSRIFCGGALHGNQWIITAGQCVDGAISFQIQLGSNRLNDASDPERRVVAADEYFLHPDYSAYPLDNDIGIIKLRMPIELSDYIQPIYNIALDDTPADWRVLVIGWGEVSDDVEGLSEHLNWVALTTITNNECKQTYGNQITDNMMCAAGNYNEGICRQDTGSPLIYLIKYGAVHLVGVSSFVSGNGCESVDPSGYTRTWPYWNWIKDVTGITPP